MQKLTSIYMKRSFIPLAFILVSLLPQASRGLGWGGTGYYYTQIVWAISEYNGMLQVGGQFSSPNAIRASANYNGFFFEGGSNQGAATDVFRNTVSVGTVDGGNNLILSFAEFNGLLYMAGDFATVNGNPAQNIAIWNGSTWSAVGTGIAGTVNALCVFNNELYAGGNFGVAKWNGSVWLYCGSLVATGSSALVRGLAVYNGSLYAGGFFDLADGNTAVNIAKWNGNVWSPAGDIGIAQDIGNGVSALAEYNGELYAGGHFSIAGGVSAENIARYNGSGWNALGSGTNGTVTALYVYNQSLIAGGIFTLAGGVTVGNTASWTNCMAAINASGATTFCAGNNVLLSSSVSGTSYQWQLNNVNIPGAINSSYLASVAGNYRCFMSVCGNPYSNVISVLVNPLPSASITVNGPKTFCSGGSVTLQAPAAVNRSYQWKKDGIDIPGAIGSSFIASASGTYKAIVTNTNTGCVKTTGTGTPITVYSNPIASVTPQGATTFCAGDSVQLKTNYNSNYSYQWKRNNTSIAGATTNKFEAKIAGNYKVKATNSNGCTVISNPVSVTVPCRIGNQENREADEFSVQALPNPSSGNFVFEFRGRHDLITIRIYDITGKLLHEKVTMENNYLLPDAFLVTGLYSAIVDNGKEIIRTRIVKIK